MISNLTIYDFKTPLNSPPLREGLGVGLSLSFIICHLSFRAKPEFWCKGTAISEIPQYPPHVILYTIHLVYSIFHPLFAPKCPTSPTKNILKPLLKTP